MKTHFEFLRITRNNLQEALDGLSTEQLNTIPRGFRNNIIWNAAHILVTQQLLHYALSDRPCKVEQSIINRYRKGTDVGNLVTAEEITFIKKMLAQTPPWLEQDYKNQSFGTYKTYTTSYNATLHNIEEAIVFNNIHESLHLGYIMAQKKALS